MKDDVILRRLRGKDPGGLEQLMDKYIPYVSAVVWNILRFSMTAEDAEEVVSDVFLTAWERAGDILPGAAKAWLGAVARNKAKNKLREVSSELPLEDDLLDIPGGEMPEERMARREEARLVREAVDGLDEPDRTIFLRHYYYAQTVREIADRMGMNESTVKTKLRRGRQRLKSHLTGRGVL